MYNFYEYFCIEHDANIKTIILAYRNKISKYFIYNDLSDRQIYEIKMLKTGLYILTNKKLRKKYNKLIKIQNEIDINTTKKYQFDNNISNINIAPMYINKNASTNIEEIPKDDNPSDNKIYDSEQQTEMNHMFKTELQDIVVSEKYDSKKELINPLLAIEFLV